MAFCAGHTPSTSVESSRTGHSTVRTRPSFCGAGLLAQGPSGEPEGPGLHSLLTCLRHDLWGHAVVSSPHSFPLHPAPVP